MFDLAVRRHPQASGIISLHNPYDMIYSIKDSDHVGGTGEASFVGGDRNIYMKKNNSLPSPKHFNVMFKNQESKIRLQQFLKAEFKTLLLPHPDKKLFT